MLFDYGIVLGMLMSIIILLITGYLLYMLIRHPIMTLGFIFKGMVLLALGLLVWLGLIYLVTL